MRVSLPSDRNAGKAVVIAKQVSEYSINRLLFAPYEGVCDRLTERAWQRVRSASTHPWSRRQHSGFLRTRLDSLLAH